VRLYQIQCWRFRPPLLACLTVLLLLLSLAPVDSPVRAQSFDCTKARTTVETTICADASLQAQDVQLAQAYARLLAATQQRDPEKAAQLRDEQRRWVQDRDRSCAAQGEAPARIAACLAELYRARSTALAAAVSAPAPSLPPAGPEPSARLSGATVSASADGQGLLTVEASGRFAIRAVSKTGVALQLVDMITGPGDVAGEPGVRDGRLDVLLDKGVYKLRSFGAKGATGEAQIVVEPFRNAVPASAELLHSGEFSGELADLQQRSYWTIVGRNSRVSVEAVGRALQDLRLWRNGVELAALTPTLASLETRPGRLMTRARLEGQVEPGLYLVTAYGGAALPWSDEDKAQPLHVRVGGVSQLVGGWAEGTIGPFGSVRFEAPPPDTYARLELPDPAPARLVGIRQRGATQTASITKTSREPVASLTLPLVGNEPARLEVAGFEGQAFRLRTLRPSTVLRVDASGPHLVSVDVAGEGSDELPATAVFARFEKGKGTVLASNAPRLAPGQAWRRTFNLRGTSTVLFEIAGAGPVAAQASGPGVRVSLEPLLGNTAPRFDGRTPLSWDVEPGWYVLKIDPINNGAGVLDLTFGQPGLAVEAAAAAPPRAAILFGVHDLVKSAYYQVFTNMAPGLVTGPKVRALPADLAAASLSLFQPAASSALPEKPRTVPQSRQPVAPKPGAKPAPQGSRAVQQRPSAPAPAPVASPVGSAAAVIDVPVHIPVGGTLRVVDATGAPVAFTTSGETPDKTGRTLVVHIPSTDRDRAIALTWTPAAALLELPTPQQQVSETLPASQPRFFDLARDERRSMLLEVQEGGLYRVETLGRLQTALQVSTPFVPGLASASDNGPGHNAQLQTYLRAGVYRVSVAAQASAGHLGLVATPAPLQEIGTLVAGGSTRASLVAGRGAIVPIEVAAAGVYRLDLYGLNRTFTARLEDAEGWPLSPPGELSRLEQRFEPGRYRLVVIPADVDTRVVARLTPVETPVEPEGHGPHALTFDQVQKFQWREPEAKDAPRTPDRWVFTLYGTAHVVLEVSDGMIADLTREDGGAPPLAKIIYKRGFSDALPAGRYVVEARSLGRNDRLDYELTLRATEMQPEHVRFVNLPATIPFAIAQDRIVSFTTFGRTDLTGVLKNADGRVIERLSGRSDDWNIAMSRRLAAGSYQLELAPTTAESSSADRAEDDTDNEAERRSSAPAEGNAETGIEVRFALPAAVEAGELAFDSTQQLSGPQAHQFILPAAEADRLVLVAAQASAELVLALERRDAAAGWRTIGFERGKAPVLAVPSDGEAQHPWWVIVWAVDGGRAPFTITARALRAQPQALGQVTLAPLRLDALEAPVVLAQVSAPSSTLLAMRGAPDTIRAGSTPGRVLGASSNGLVVPQTERLWLLARSQAPVTVTLEPVRVSGALALTLNEGDMARIPGEPVPSGHLRFWRAESAFGQPGLDAGRGMGVAPGSAFGQDSGETLRVWNADGEAALRLRVAVVDAQALPSTPLDTHYAALVPAHSAQPLDLTPGAKQFDISLAASMAAVLSGGETPPVTIWAGDRAASRTLVGNWPRLVLVNAGTAAAPAAVDVMPGAGGGLAAGQAMKRFFGASGSLSLQVDAAVGDRLVVAGAQATFIARSGRVMRGTSLMLSEPGALVLDHDPGLVAAWIERNGTSPWPSAPARRVTPPQSLPLAGEAMAIALEQPGPALVRARTTAPVILSLTQGDAPSSALAFPAGADLYRYLAAGSAALRLYSPYDGPLGGSLELTATPIEPVGEGLGEVRVLAPGGTVLFGFEVTRAGEVGAGVRSEPDRADVRVLDESGRVVGEGVAQMRRLEPGRYVLEVRAPTQGATLTVRPALVGLAPPPTGPPPDVAAQYLEMVGLTPSGTR
jgi:uncharacterized protein